jgi:ribulose-5-phosphate 4-epimerase/fuculose-1-phosphate aldolase
MTTKTIPLRDTRTKALRSRTGGEEWQARIDLAAAYRLADLYGMSDMIYTHISLRVPGEPRHFLINPHGLLFDEVTASSLLKVDLDGNVLYQQQDAHGLQRAGYVIHSALYLARPDINAAMHTHTIAGMAVSALKCGLLPLTQTATRFHGRLAYHDFNGPERDPAEREALARDLGRHNYMILRNHGLLTVGATIAEAFTAMYGLERSCQAQVTAMACNTPLNEMPEAIVTKSIGMYDPGVIRRYGLLEWPGLLRRLDRRDPSFRD